MPEIIETIPFLICEPDYKVFLTLWDASGFIGELSAEDEEACLEAGLAKLTTLPVDKDFEDAMKARAETWPNLDLALKDTVKFIPWYV